MNSEKASWLILESHPLAVVDVSYVVGREANKIIDLRAGEAGFELTNARVKVLVPYPV